MTPLVLKQVNDEATQGLPQLDHSVPVLTQSHGAGTPVTPGGPEPGAELLLLVSAQAGSCWYHLDHTLIDSVAAARTPNHLWPRCCQKHGGSSRWRVDLTGLLTHICVCI